MALSPPAPSRRVMLAVGAKDKDHTKACVLYQALVVRPATHAHLSLRGRLWAFASQYILDPSDTVYVVHARLDASPEWKMMAQAGAINAGAIRVDEARRFCPDITKILSRRRLTRIHIFALRRIGCLTT